MPPRSVHRALLFGTNASDGLTGWGAGVKAYYRERFREDTICGRERGTF